MRMSSSGIRLCAVALALVSLVLVLTLTAAQQPAVFANSTDVFEVWESNFLSIRSGGVVSSVMGSAVDPNDGTVTVVGYATGSLLSHTTAGGYDAFAVKTDPRTGAVIWSRWFATAQDDLLMGVCVDAAGNLFLNGFTLGYMQGQTALGSRDLFVVKLTADGTQLWIHQLGTTQDEVAGNCVVDVYGQPYIIGASVGGYLGVYQGTWSLFILALSTVDGSKVWGRNLGGPGGSQYLWNAVTSFPNAGSSGGTNVQAPGGRGLSIIQPIANASSMPLLVVSCFLDSASVFPDAPATGAGGLDSVVAAYYSVNGSLVWAQRYASNGDDAVYSTATDASGATFVTGYTTSNLDGGLYTAAGDIFLSKITVTGSKLWTRLYGTSLTDVGAAVVVDNAGGVYVTGTTQTTSTGSLDHAPNAYTQTFPSTGGSPIQMGFLSKFDSDGARLWTDLFSPSMPLVQVYYYGPSITPATMSIDPVTQQIYIAGKKSGYLNSDPLQTGLSSGDLFDDETFTLAVQQSPTNCTLQQFDTLLAQINTLLLGL